MVERFLVREEIVKEVKDTIKSILKDNKKISLSKDGKLQISDAYMKYSSKADVYLLGRCSALMEVLEMLDRRAFDVNTDF